MNATIVYYHGNDWDGVRARQRYLMQALAQHFRIIFLDGSRPRGFPIRRRSPQRRVTVISGLVSFLSALERRGLAWLARGAGRFLSRGWKRKGESLLFWNAENTKRPFRFLPHDRLIFDCIDPCLNDDPAVEVAHDRREAEMLRAAHLVFASAADLEEKCRALNPRTRLLNNACEPSDYAEPLRKTPPEWWPASGRPVIAYMGTLDRRVDFGMLRAVAARMPDVDFVLAGVVVPACAEAVEELRRMPHVHCPGRISVEDGHYLMSQCAVGLIPFLAGAMNDAVNPVKLYAYALLGKPVVGTPLRELLLRPATATTAADADSFAAGVRAAIERGASPQVQGELREFALQNTWQHRAQIAAREIWLLLGEETAPAPASLTVPQSPEHA